MSADTTFNNENEVLLLCAHAEATPDLLDHMDRLLARDLDWTYLVRTAFSHRLIPLLNRCLQYIGEPRVPGDILYAFRYRAEQNHQRSRHLADELLSLARSFEEAGVAAIPFKGPVPAILASSDLAQDQESDLGFIVREQEVASSHQLLAARGYRHDYHDERGLLAAQSAPSRRFLHSHRYHRVKDRLTVEVLWAFAFADAAIEVKHDELWRHAVLWRCEDGELRVLSLEDQLMVLCLQGALEEWHVLGTIADVARLLRRRPDLDLDVASELARSRNCEDVLRLGLTLAERLAGAQLSRPAVADGRRLERLCTEARAGLFEHDLEGTSTSVHGPASPMDPAGRGDGNWLAHVAASKARAREHWTSRSSVWERWSDRTLAGTRELNQELFTAAGISTGHRVLDLACGPGDASLVLGELVGATGSVTSTDLVPSMVGVTYTHAKVARLTNLRCCVADMEALPFVDRSFDSVVCRLGIMYCPRVELALSEACRVLRPEGRAAFLVCGTMENNHILAIVHSVLWELFDVWPEESPIAFRFAPKDSLASLMRQTGFTRVGEQELRRQRTVPRGNRFWQPSAERALGWELQSLPPATREELERRMEAAFEAHLDGEEYRLSSHSRLAFGTRSEEPARRA